MDHLNRMDDCHKLKQLLYYRTCDKRSVDCPKYQIHQFNAVQDWKIMSSLIPEDNDMIMIFITDVDTKEYAYTNQNSVITADLLVV